MDYVLCVAVGAEGVKSLLFENWHRAVTLDEYFLLTRFGFGVGILYFIILFCLRLAFAVRCSVMLVFAQTGSMRNLML